METLARYRTNHTLFQYRNLRRILKPSYQYGNPFAATPQDAGDEAIAINNVKSAIVIATFDRPVNLKL